jgi:hypothetical protein
LWLSLLAIQASRGTKAGQTFWTLAGNTGPLD